MNNTLTSRILRETASFAALQVVGAVFVWVSTLALTRLLDPRAYGVYNIGMMLVGLGTLLGDGGLGAALLRKREEVTQEEYRATLTLLLAVGAVCATALALLAPRIAIAYHLRPDEARVLRAMAPLYLTGPLRAVPYIRLERALSFARIAQIELAATIAGRVVAVVLAAASGGAWALAGASLTSAAVQLSLSYLISPGWPGLRMSLRTIRPLLSYGIRVQGLAVAAYFKDNLGAMILGATLGPRSVGLFDFGVKYAQVPVQAVNALGRVQLPVYARFSANDPTLHTAVRGALRVALLLGGAMLVVTTIAAPWIVPVLFRPVWLAATPVIYGLVANMAGGLVVGPLFALMQGQGAAGLAVRVFTVWTLATWLLVFASYRLGLGAVAASYSVVTVIVTVYLVRWASRHLDLSLGHDLMGASVAGVVSVAAGIVARDFAGLPRWASHPLSAAMIALTIYVLTLVLVEGKRVATELADVVRALLRRPDASVTADEAHGA